MKFRCNSITSVSTESHKSDADKICTLEAVDSYSSSITSGVVNMSTDITNGALAAKIYYCPKCHEKLLWDKKYKVDGDKLSAGAVGTFTMLNDDGKTEATITGQYGVDRSEDDVEEDQQGNIETLPEYGQSRYKYNKTDWTSTTETEDQKNSISWEDSSGNVYYGTKAMNNIERGIYEANRKFNFRELQTKNLATALMKLRMNKETSFAMWGDSVFAGFWYLEGDEYKKMYEADNFEDDYGMEYKGYDRCVTRIPETLVDTLKKVYGADKITMSRLVWNGVTVSNNKTSEGKPVDYSIFSHWKASQKDIAIMNFGINDSIGNHLPTNYMGNVSAFISGYKALIERELENGTAVVVISPFRLCTVGIEKDIKADIDDRTIIDIYEQALYSLCQEYGVPFIDGSIMLKNFDNSMYLDLSHLMPEGNESLGKRLASIFIGQNPLRPLTVNHNTYLSVMHQYSNCKLTGTANFSYSETSPNIKTGVSINMVFPDTPSEPTPEEPNVPPTEGSPEDQGSTAPETEDQEQSGPVPEEPGDQEKPDQEESEKEENPEEESEEEPEEEAEEEDSEENEESGSEEVRTATPAPQGKPTITITKPEGAIQCVLKTNEDSIIWSFYAEHDGLVAIPSFESTSASAKVSMELDFGANQGTWANYWNYINTEKIDRTYKEPSSIEYKHDNLKDNKFGYHMINSTYNKAIKIVSEGWHTVKLTAKDLSENETIKVYGLTFMDIKEFEKATKAVD